MTGIAGAAGALLPSTTREPGRPPRTHSLAPRWGARGVHACVCAQCKGCAVGGGAVQGCVLAVQGVGVHGGARRVLFKRCGKGCAQGGARARGGVQACDVCVQRKHREVRGAHTAHGVRKVCASSGASVQQECKVCVYTGCVCRGVHV